MASQNAQDKAIDLLAIPGEHRFRAENLPFGIDVWYRRLQEVTFETHFTPLTRQEGQAITAFYQTRFNGRKKLTLAHVSALLQLEARIDQLMADKFQGRSAFMRLSDRSPKDADPLEPQLVWHEYLQRLEEAQAEVRYPEGFPSEPSNSPETSSSHAEEGLSLEDLASNTKMIAIGRVNFLRVTNGSEAMSLLLTSERVFSDCLDWLQYGEPVMIALREFEPEVVLENEFRAFVFRHQLTAISQYDHYTYYPALQGARQSRLKALIHAEWQRIHPLVGEESYCIDFCYLPSKDSVRMIEISPFLPCTGPACFNWKLDYPLLADPSPSFDAIHFRTVQKPRANLAGVIESNWNARWNTPSAPYYLTYAQFFPRTTLPAASPSLWGKLLRFAGIDATPPASDSPPSEPPNSRLISREEWRASLRQSYMDHLSASEPAPTSTLHVLFVYGTLKHGFHWNQKFLSRATRLGDAQTVLPFPLVVGACGVPYLLGDQPELGFPIRGQIYQVDGELLEGMDDYEGVTKAYYERRQIDVVDATTQTTRQAWVYLLPQSSDELRCLPHIPEYTLEIHDQKYMPIRHIQVKQQRYLGLLDSYSISS